MMPAARMEDIEVYPFISPKYTIKLMGEVVRDTLDQTADLAKEFRLQYPQNNRALLEAIWQFCRPLKMGGEINYRDDRDQKEQVRDPARTWADRIDGVDCDCISTFMASLLLNLGFEVAFRKVDLYGEGWCHVYVIAYTNNSGYTLDPNPDIDEFNQELAYKRKKDYMVTMRLRGTNELSPEQEALKNILQKAQANIKITGCFIGGLPPIKLQPVLEHLIDSIGTVNEGLALADAAGYLAENQQTKVKPSFILGYIRRLGDTTPPPANPSVPSDTSQLMQLFQLGQQTPQTGAAINQAIGANTGSASGQVGQAVGGVSAGAACAAFGIPPQMCAQIGSMMGGFIGNFFGNADHRCDGVNVSDYGKYLQRLQIAIDGTCKLDNGDANGYANAIKGYAWGPLLVWAHATKLAAEKQRGATVDFKGALWVITRPVANPAEAQPMGQWLADWSTWIGAQMNDQAKRWNWSANLQSQVYPYAPFGTNLNWNTLPAQIGSLKMPEGYPQSMQAVIQAQTSVLPATQTTTGGIDFTQPQNKRMLVRAIVAYIQAARAAQGQAPGNGSDLENAFMTNGDAGMWLSWEIGVNDVYGAAPSWSQADSVRIYNVVQRYYNTVSDAGTPAAPVVPPSEPVLDYPSDTPMAKEGDTDKDKGGIVSWIQENTFMALAIAATGGFVLYKTVIEKPKPRRRMSGTTRKRTKK
jgi:hypothetical protein